MKLLLDENLSRRPRCWPGWAAPMRLPGRINVAD